MEKLDLQIFRELKQEIVDIIERIQEAEEQGLEYSEEELQKFLDRYKEIMDTLSQYDLSDIDFEEWRGMYLLAQDDMPIDFSKTKANLDFSIITYESGKAYPNLKSCQIKNFNFDKFDYSPDMFDEEFRKEHEGRFLSEEVPESVREHYYGHHLSMQEFSGNLQHFEGKTVAHSFRDYDDERKMISLYGEDIYQLFADYKPIIDRLLSDDTAMQSIVVPTGPITEEQRKEIMSTALTTYITWNDLDQVENWDEFKMILDFIPMEYLPATPSTREFIEKYGIDRIIESGLDIKYLFKDQKLTNIEEIASLNGIELEDIRKLVSRDGQRILDSYDVKQLLEYGITDLSETTNDLSQIREMLKKRPLDLINMGKYQDTKKEFIKKYGIDNIIALDEETGGMFSHQMWSDNIYLTLFAHAEGNAPKLDGSKELSYDEFKDRMYEILLHARDERGPLQSRDYPDYDFIQGKFREEHPDIFLDGELPEDVKKAFYTRHMTAEMIRQNPELIKLLQGKDFSRAFAQKMTAGISLQMMDKDGNAIGGVPNTVNMAQYLSEKLGQEEFLKICADYGKCLDSIGIMTKGEVSVESVQETIEQAIYKGIKEKGIEYFEELPLSFQEKHPELFLPKEVDEELRSKFYAGKLSFEDIRQNPQIKQLLLTKDISVGFGRTKYGQEMLARPGGRYVNPMWEKLTEQEIMDLAEEYGKYLKDVNADIFIEGQSAEDREIAVQENIEENILNRESPYDESIPEFFKQRHPEMFLDENAPRELKDLFYDGNRINGIPIFGRTSKTEISFEAIKNHPEWKRFK